MKIYLNRIKDKYLISSPKFFRFISLSEGYIDAPDIALTNRLFALPVETFSKGNICIKNRIYEIYDAVERLSGDCYFNFNSLKINKLKEISGIDIKKLKECGNMHHSIYNMVLLQSVGNMQARKQHGLKLFNNKYENLDRGDTFLYLLNEYYENGNEEILAASTKQNKNVLREYLESFNGIYDYADTMLQIKDKDFLKKILENGQQLLLDQDSANKYLDIALEFWEKRKSKIESMIKEI